MSLKKNISLNFASQLVNLFLGFGVSILISRMLGPAGRGDYILVITSANFFVQFFTFGIESSISHYVAARKVAMERLLSTLIVCVLSIALLMTISIIALSMYSGTFLIPENSFYYHLALILLCLFMFLNNIYSSILSGARLFRQVIFINTGIQVLMLAVCIFFFIISPGNELTAKILIMAMVGIYFLISVTYTVVYIRFVKARPSWNFMSKLELKLFFSYSLIAFVCAVLQFLNYRMDFWVINAWWGSEQLGIYSLAAGLSQLLWVLPQSISMIMFPMSSYYGKPELLDITNRLLRISIFIMLVIVIPLLLLSPFFIPLLFGKEFAGAVMYFQLFLIGIFPFILIKIFASVFAGIGKIIYNLWASFTGFLVGAIAYLTLIPLLGPVGGVIGSIASYLLSTITGLYFYKKEFNSPITEMIFIKKTDLQFLKLQARTIMGLNK